MTTMAARLVPQFITFRCDCGRTLRVKWEQAGEEVQCWDCHEYRTVIAPRPQGRLAGRMARASATFVFGEGMARAITGALLITLMLMIPNVGMILAALALVAGAAIYADMIRSGRDENVEFAIDFRRLAREMTPAQLMACLGLVAGTVGPLWSLGLGHRRSPHLGPAGPVILGLSWTIFPLMLVALSRPRAGGDAEVEREDEVPAPTAGRFEPFLTLARFPLLTLMTLLIVPGSLLACEALLDGLFYMTGGLPTLALDYMPRRPGYINQGGFILFGTTLQADLPLAQILHAYWHGLRQGYSFVGSIPPSFSLDTRWGIDPRSIFWSIEGYAVLRVLAIFLIALALTLGFALQARCLNVLTHARRRFLA